MKHLLIWGAGDQGTVTLDRALAMKRYNRIDFLDMKEKGHRSIPGYAVYEEEEVNLSGFLRSYNEAIVTVGSNDLRKVKTSRLMSLDISLTTVICPTAVISPFSHISRGCAVLAWAAVNPNAHVGTGCIMNMGAIIEHDYIIGDFANICPDVSMTRHTKIGRKSLLGIGSTVMDDITVGEEPVVGAGIVVTRNVPDRVAVAGVPAKEIHS